MDWLDRNNLSLIKVLRRYTLAVVASSAALEYGVIYCLYMTIDGALYRAGLKKVGDYARFTSFESSEAEEALELSQMGTDAYIAEKQAELGPKTDAIIAEARERKKQNEKQNE